MPIAGDLRYPILLVEVDAIPAATAAQLTRLEPGRITILGGTAVIGADVEAMAADYTDGPVDRIAGANRYETAAALVEEFMGATSFAQDGDVVAYIATGDSFADSLSLGPVAVVTGGPLLLVQQDAVPDATAAALASLSPDRIVIVGGEAVVSAGVAEALTAFTDGPVDRWAGPNRYATAAAVSSQGFPGATSTVYMATGSDYPDALAGGVAAGMDRAPLLVVQQDCVPAEVLAEIERLGATNVVVLGGPNAVSDAAAALTPCSGDAG